MEQLFIYPQSYYDKFNGLEEMIKHLNINSNIEIGTGTKTIVWNIFNLNFSSKINSQPNSIPEIIIRNDIEYSILAMDHFNDWFAVSSVSLDFKNTNKNLEILFNNEIKHKIITPITPITPTEDININNLIIAPLLTLQGCLIIGIFILNQRHILSSLNNYNTTLYSFLVKINSSITKQKFNIFKNIENDYSNARIINLRYGYETNNYIQINHIDFYKFITPYSILFNVRCMDKYKIEWTKISKKSKLKNNELYDNDN